MKANKIRLIKNAVAPPPILDALIPVPLLCLRGLPKQRQLGRDVVFEC